MSKAGPLQKLILPMQFIGLKSLLEKWFCKILNYRIWSDRDHIQLRNNIKILKTNVLHAGAQTVAEACRAAAWGDAGAAPCRPQPAPTAPLQGTAGPHSQDGGALPQGQPGDGRANATWQGEVRGAVQGAALRTPRGEEEEEGEEVGAPGARAKIVLQPMKIPW